MLIVKAEAEHVSPQHVPNHMQESSQNPCQYKRKIESHDFKLIFQHRRTVPAAWSEDKAVRKLSAAAFSSGLELT